VEKRERERESTIYRETMRKKESIGEIEREGKREGQRRRARESERERVRARESEREREREKEREREREREKESACATGAPVRGTFRRSLLWAHLALPNCILLLYMHKYTRTYT